MEYFCPGCRESVSIEEDSPDGSNTCPQCGSSLTSESEETSTYLGEESQVVGHFQLQSRLGTGSFGAVWAARDLKLDREVALKFPRDQSLSPEQQSRFLREAQAAARLAHPNIVSVHEVGSDNEQLFIVSDMIDGDPLSEVLRRKPLPRETAIHLCRTLADALQHAHDKGVVHRDLKPANILIDDRHNPHITDFGLAKRDAGEATISSEGQILGTPAYMAPEQAAGQSHTVDRRADVYSLGVILFELLTGERPFRGASRALLQKVIQDEPPRLRSLDTSIPVDLETICLKCLEKRREARYESAGEVRDELDRFLRNEPIKARPINSVSRGWRWLRRRPAVLAFAGGTALGLVLFATVLSLAAWTYRTQSLVANTKLDQVTEAKKKIETELEETLAQVRSRQAAKWAHVDREIGAIESIQNRMEKEVSGPEFDVDNTLRQFPIQGASADSWILTMASDYQVPAMSEFPTVNRELLREYRLSAKAVQKLHLDRNADGLIDAWGYFSDGELAIVEWDTHRVGAPNNRVDILEQVGERAASWFVEPTDGHPLPPVNRPEFETLFSRAAPIGEVADSETAEQSAQRTQSVSETLARDLYPDLNDFVVELAAQHPLPVKLEQTAHDLAQLLHSNLERFRSKAPDESKLRDGNRWQIVYLPFDLDDEPGFEWAVGYSPEGIVRIAAFEGDWTKRGNTAKLRMLGHITDGELTRIDFLKERLLRLARHWVELNPASRQNLADDYLVPGFQDWTEGNWYKAIEVWRMGVRAAALCGDFLFDTKGEPVSPSTLNSDLTSRRLGPSPSVLTRGGWEFESQELSAATLLELASAIVWQNRHVVRPLRSIANHAIEKKQFEEALRFFTLTLSFADKLGEEIVAINVLDQRSQLYSLMGNFHRALDDAERAVAQTKAIGYLAELEKSARNLSSKPDASDLDRARSMRQHATEVNHACRLGRIAGLHIVLGNIENARRSIAEAEEAFERLGHGYGLADARQLRARLAMETDQTRNALSLTREAFQSAEDSTQAQRIVESPASRNAFRDGAIYQFELKEEKIKTIVSLRSDRKYGNYFAALELLLGDIMLQLAVEQSSTGTPDANSVPSPTTEDDLQRMQRCLEDSEAHYAAAERGFEVWGDELGMVIAQLRRARVAIYADKADVACQHCRRAKERSSKLKLQHLQWAADAEFGAALAKRGRREDAVRELTRAAAEIEATRTLGSIPSSHATLLLHGNDVFEQLAVVKAGQSQDLDVWRCFERSKRQRLLESKLLSGAESKDTSPAATLPSLERVQRLLHEDEQLLYLWPTQSALLIMAVSHEQLIVRQVKCTRSDVRKQAATFRRLLDQGDTNRPRSDYEEAFRATARQLYRDWLKPVVLPATRRLTIVADDTLAYIPFHALINEKGKYLIEYLDVRYATSGLQRAGAGEIPLPPLASEPHLLLVQIDDYEDPVSQLQLVSPYDKNVTVLHNNDSKNRSGGDATAATETLTTETLAAHLRAADILHFAGAVYLPSSRPAASAMILDRTWMQNTPSRNARRAGLSDIALLETRRCRLGVMPTATPLSMAGQGDELSAFVDAWNTAGVPHVLLSAWRGDARQRQELLARLHQNLAQGAETAQAWRSAQLDYLATQQDGDTFIHPRNWAGLMMFGP